MPIGTGSIGEFAIGETAGVVSPVVPVITAPTVARRTLVETRNLRGAMAAAMSHDVLSPASALRETHAIGASRTLAPGRNGRTTTAT